ncbi:hypothetical protein GUITHDRAFT_116286 [Guillardia theta CCMP2712]|uniref:Sfi1 spindle body domain-containing protein n=1 Tax=Guillardia theta (strain CCMP2712) TaxID=905079 RepID=L1INT1_GUITC|nr:hypothetical protein GUITHDRAFT_116286 [Guillardia theta CCMP2712]EKX37475.1 hypothetical protein GUITHDRAFT_116286 [Guillardia theta CCMP2712]|eukprot:XP_005824455.1 hypothetical protein GUITHDRAFT_116286 [Guillardia theta CCMP2712]
MFHIQLATAFDSYRERVDQRKERRTLCRRVVERMLQARLAAAFDRFQEAVEGMARQRARVTAVIGRWTQPWVSLCFESWLEATDEARRARAAEGLEEVQAELTAEAEKQREYAERYIELRKEQSRKVIKRMFHIQLATAFDSYRERVDQRKERRTLCRRVVERMLQARLAAAFDRFQEAVEGMARQRARVTAVIGRWTQPWVSLCFESWLEATDEARRARAAEGLEEVQAELTAEAEKQREYAERYIELRKEQSRKVIKRMFHIQLATAFDSYRERVDQRKERRTLCRRVVERMLQARLAAAFDRFQEAVEGMARQRARVTAVIGRWTQPWVSLCFESWLEATDEARRARAAEGLEEVQAELTAEAEKQREYAERYIELRKEQSRKVIKRMFHIQLATAFDSYRERVDQRKERRTLCRRVVERMLQARLAAAFDRFQEAVEGMARQRARVTAVIGRWTQPWVSLCFESWLEATDEARRARAAEGLEEVQAELTAEAEKQREYAERYIELRKEQSRKVIKRMFHIQLATAFDSYRERVDQRKERRTLCRRVVERMLQARLAAAFDRFQEAVEGMARQRARVTAVIGRWTQPWVSLCFESWLEATDEARRARAAEGLEEVQAELTAEAEKQREYAERYIELRKEQSRKVIKRMFHIQLATAFDSYRERVDQRKERRTLCRRVVERMLQARLAAAFDRFQEAVEGMARQRARVTAVIGRWTQPWVSLCFESWLEATDEARRARAAEGLEEVQAELTAEAEKQREYAERYIELRKEQSRKVIKRMFHIQLATAFDSYRERVDQRKERRTLCRRVVERMLQARLAAAFDRFQEAVEGMARQRARVTAVIGRWLSPLLSVVFLEWASFVLDRSEFLDVGCMTDAGVVFDEEISALREQLSDALSREEYLIRVSKKKSKENQEILEDANSLRQRCSDLEKTNAFCSFSSFAIFRRYQSSCRKLSGSSDAVKDIEEKSPLHPSGLAGAQLEAQDHFQMATQEAGERLVRALVRWREQASPDLVSTFC